MRGALVLVLFAVTTVSAAPHARKPKHAAHPDGARASEAAKPAEGAKPAEAKADTPAAPAPAAAPAAPSPLAPTGPGPDDAKAVAILERIAAGPDTAARKLALAELLQVAPGAIEAIAGWLGRAHRTELADRREVLAEIKASVPDKTGKFSQPPRQTGKEQKADDDLDWQAELLAVDPAARDDAHRAALGEVIADDAAIRALAHTNEIRAAQRVFDAAFGADTAIYRDECGRYLRKMEPASIPALTKESMARDYDRKRYATFQLERLDRQEPGKALDAALGDEALTLAILDVFRTTHHREAVHAVWKRIDSDTPSVRAAARAAWMEYITGPPPPPAPTAKLNLPGGKKTKKPKPLWLTYRELADNELRKAANELLHEDYPLEDPQLDDTEHEKPPLKLDLEDLTRRVFAYYDGERAKREGAQWMAAKKQAEAGDLAAATQEVDRMLAANPDRRERADMAKLYLAWGKQLEAKQQWAPAAAAYSKAHGLDPSGPAASDALAAHHYTLGKALEADGKDGGPDFRRAIALKPDYAPARTAAVEVARAARPLWMLYAAAGAALAAMVLFAAAMMRRRA
jgi:tetratricopeptide (TPR) repeat protein